MQAIGKVVAKASNGGVIKIMILKKPNLWEWRYLGELYEVKRWRVAEFEARMIFEAEFKARIGNAQSFIFA